MAQYEEKVTKFNELMKDHNDWMRNSINLIASENVTSSAVKTAMVSDLSHRYAEGQAYERFYQGCTYIDEIEDITKKLSCELYDCTYANVQPVSGVTANMAAFFGFSNIGDKMMAMNIPYGGHISHAKVSAAGICGLTTYDHPFDPSIMNIDIDAMNKKIRELEPKIILFGGSRSRAWSHRWKTIPGSFKRRSYRNDGKYPQDLPGSTRWNHIISGRKQGFN